MAVGNYTCDTTVRVRVRVDHKLIGCDSATLGYHQGSLTIATYVDHSECHLSNSYIPLYSIVA